MTKWIIGVAIVVVVGAGAWWYLSGGAKQASEYGTNTEQTATTTNPANDTSDQALLQDSASIDAQLSSFDSTQSQTQ